MEIKKCASVIISGKVQGVFFRAETQRAALRIGVTGWVRNLADGTVQALFEGSQEKLDRIIEWCRTGPPRSRVADVHVSWEDEPRGFTDFTIRY
jgi:acylphosphatase